MLDVVRMRTLVSFLMLSRWVSRAFTTLIASLGSEPDMAFFLAAVRDSTSSMRTQIRARESSINLLISVNNFGTSFPDSENHLENRLATLYYRKVSHKIHLKKGLNWYQTGTGERR